MLWALVLAVTLYPLRQRLAKRLGDRQGRAATVLVLVGLLLIGGPTVMLGGAFATQVQDAHAAFQNNTITIKPPADSVADWPVVGKKLHAAWNLAAQDLPALLKKMQPQLGNFSKAVLGLVASTAGTIFAFLGSLIIAGIIMAYGRSGSAAMLRIITRFSGPEKGPRLHNLSTATIRSVAMGVIGVAFIQALLLGVGFVWAGIPGAGILAVVALLFGIAQLPAIILSLPVIAYLWWSGDSTMVNLFFTAYLLVAGTADNVLKPLMLGRGVEVPMPIILLGALSGMATSGMIGLFLGAVLLALGYEVFMEWVDEGDAGEEQPAAAEAAAGE
jgi:predicted PurR-regulated permease PerM